MTVLTIPELLQLGGAYREFDIGNIDAGIHLVLPVRDVDTGNWTNLVFQDLIDQDFYDIDYPPGHEYATPFIYGEGALGALYMGAIVQWINRNLDLD